MPTSLFGPEAQSVLDRPRDSPGRAFASPADWRDQPIYFLMVDRFDNPSGPPVHQPFDDPDFYGFQGGKFSGVQRRLAYIRQLRSG
jgi:hypothetical protein